MKRFIFIIACLLIGYSAAGANYLTGNDLYANCNGEEVQKTMCEMWIAGFTQGMWSSQQMARRKNLAPSTCIPDEVTATQARLIFEKYVREHPEQLHFAASVMLTFVLNQAFPCNK